MKTIYLENRGRDAVTLGLETANWYPQAAQVMFSVSWDIDADFVLAPKTLIKVTVCLYAPTNATHMTTFSVDIFILTLH